MRITNNMIQRNTKSNINSNKILVDDYNTQMTTQKKISRPSENPVIAIRSLRLSTNLTKLNQYADNNIPDADAWLDVTETALKNMKSILTDIRTQCVNGSTDTLTEDDRNTILNNLISLHDQIYAEGNADYAGRTVFTGYRSTSKLTFDTTEEARTYQIRQYDDQNDVTNYNNLSFADVEEHRYYQGNVEVPTNADSVCTEEIKEQTYYRLRLAYDKIDSVDSFAVNAQNGSSIASAITKTYETFEEWQAEDLALGDNDIIVLKDSGEIVFGKAVHDQIESQKAVFDVSYTKTGFEKGEARPEYYYDCQDITDPANVIDYIKEDQIINYTIAANTSLTVNTQASDVLDTSIARDINEMINVVQKAMSAQEKVDKITSMMTEAQYVDADSQANLKTYLDAAQKELDFANDNLQKTYGQYITNFDNYLHKTNLAITQVGSTAKRLQLTQTRVENQQSTIEELKSKNEDRDISDIIIDYYASYNAYTASLTAASKIGDQTLLNYL